MKKNNDNLILLNVIFAVSLVISNVVTSKLILTGVTLFGNNVALPGAGICYAITFLMTDVIGEIWGKTEANKTVRFGFFGQILSCLLILLTQYLPASDVEMQLAYDKLLGQNSIIVIASLTAYYLSQSWDVFVFHKIKGKFKASESVKYKWIWNNASTFSSQIIDTVVFIFIAFGLGFKWIFTPAMLPTLFSMMIGQYLFKLILAVLDTPFFYVLTMRR